MRETVLFDPTLMKHAGRFVWLSLDIDRDENAPFLNLHPVPGVPTFFVIDSASDKVVFTRSSGLDRAQLLALFDEGERAFHQKRREKADAEFAAGEERAGQGKTKEAEAAFTRALAMAPPGWPERRPLVEALLLARDQLGDAAGCSELGERETANGARDAMWANLVASGLSCALEAKDAERTRRLINRTEEALRIEALSADDRSGLYEILVQAAPDEAAKKKLAAEWLAFLENEAARAPTPRARAIYDAHRLAAARALGEPARALFTLLASERDLPDDYNAPARLGILYLEMNRFEDALSACNRALTKVYGPRRLRIEETRATIYQKKGDLPAARRVLEEAISDAAKLPASPRTTQAVARLRKLLETLK
jgi:tetratricopeptide (TPR) repeat protein